MRAYAVHKWSKVQPDRFNFRDFSSKKPNFELTTMHSASSERRKLRLSYDLELWPGCSAPRDVRDKILATVPWSILAGKNSEMSPKIDDFSGYKN